MSIIDGRARFMMRFVTYIPVSRPRLYQDATDIQLGHCSHDQNPVHELRDMSREDLLAHLDISERIECNAELVIDRDKIREDLVKRGWCFKKVYVVAFVNENDHLDGGRINGTCGYSLQDQHVTFILGIDKFFVKITQKASVKSAF